MIRGEIRWADVEPATGPEAGKTRPAVIGSNDAANAATRAATSTTLEPTLFVIACKMSLGFGI